MTSFNTKANRRIDNNVPSDFTLGDIDLTTGLQVGRYYNKNVIAMGLYTDEQWKIIRQAAPHYESAQLGYVRNAPRWLTEQVVEVYEAATGNTLQSKNLSCATCVLNIYSIIGRTYFKELSLRK